MFQSGVQHVELLIITGRPIVVIELDWVLEKRRVLCREEVSCFVTQFGLLAVHSERARTLETQGISTFVLKTEEDQAVSILCLQDAFDLWKVYDGAEKKSKGSVNISAVKTDPLMASALRITPAFVGGTLAASTCTVLRKKLASNLSLISLLTGGDVSTLLVRVMIGLYQSLRDG